MCHNSARRLARREKGDDEDETEETSNSPTEVYVDNDEGRRPQRCDSRDNSGKFTAYLIVYFSHH